jgi:hypothetical protein
MVFLTIVKKIFGILAPGVPVEITLLHQNE